MTGRGAIFMSSRNASKVWAIRSCATPRPCSRLIHDHALTGEPQSTDSSREGCPRNCLAIRRRSCCITSVRLSPSRLNRHRSSALRIESRCSGALSSQLLSMSVVTRFCACLLAVLLANCAVVRVKPVKPALAEHTWTSFDGKEMPWQAGNPVAAGNLRAVVITIHGLSGAASDFWMLEDTWPPEGIAVYGLQLRGMGNDPEKSARGDIRSAEAWQRDLLTFHRLVRQRHPGVPVFWYAESMGTLVALHTIVDLMPPDEMRPTGLIFASPAAGLRLRPKGARATLLYTIIAVAPWMRVNLEKLAGVKDKDIRVTHDTTHEARMAVTAHYVSRFSLRLLGEIDKMMRSLPTAAPRFREPVLVLASPNDIIASEEQVADFFNQLGSKDKTIHWYRDSYHLLLHDTQRAEVLHDATQWVKQRIPER